MPGGPPGRGCLIPNDGFRMARGAPQSDGSDNQRLGLPRSVAPLRSSHCVIVHTYRIDLARITISIFRIHPVAPGRARTCNPMITSHILKTGDGANDGAFGAYLAREIKSIES